MTARKSPKGTPEAKPPQYADRYPGAKPVEQAVGWTQFTEVGQEIVGTFMGIERFRNGWKGEVNTDSGPVVFSTPSLLLGKLKGLEVGTSLAIVYVGESSEPPKPGQSPLKEFEVYILN